jgi:hypothetical protein
MTEGRIKMHNEKVHNLYSAPTIISMIKSRKMRWVRHEAHIGMKNAHTILVEKREEKRPLGRPKHR